MRSLFTDRRTIASIATLICVSIFLITGSQRVFTTPINISTNQYEAALMKWNNLHVSEYEQTFEDMVHCRRRIVVQINYETGSPVETVTQYESLGSALPYDEPFCKDDVSGKDAAPPMVPTVGVMFELVDYVLANPAESATNPYHGFREYYSVQFDPTLGYPNLYDIYNDYGYHTTITIENLEILK